MSTENASLNEIEDIWEPIGKEKIDELNLYIKDLSDLDEKINGIADSKNLINIAISAVNNQFYSQLGINSGEEFIKSNNDKTLDLRSKSHIQTADNFEKGIIADHNENAEMYKERYNNWQNSFEKDNNNEIKTYVDRTGVTKKKLNKDARKRFDKDRPKGSKKDNLDIDHTISVGEMKNDAAFNAFVSEESQLQFANSKANLHAMDSSMNRSKKDLPMSEWLDNPNSNNQKPRDIFDDLTEEKEQEFRNIDKEARVEYDKLKDKGKNEVIKTGKESQKMKQKGLVNKC